MENHSNMKQILFVILVIGFIFSACHPSHNDDNKKGLDNDDLLTGEPQKDSLNSVESRMNFRSFFHHDDSVKLAREFIHQHHTELKGKQDSID